MTKIEKLKSILNNNSKWPIIIQGATAKNFPKAVVLNGDTKSEELGILSTENGLVYPNWVNEINEKLKASKKVLLIIDGIDKLELADQEKFYGIIKYSGINGYKFPAGVQIVMPVEDINKVNRKIFSLSINFNME